VQAEELVPDEPFLAVADANVGRRGAVLRGRIGLVLDTRDARLDLRNVDAARQALVAAGKMTVLAGPRLRVGRAELILILAVEPLEVRRLLDRLRRPRTHRRD